MATVLPPKRGRLQIITGGSKGFSAVRLMLEKARAAKDSGIDVIVGRVNFRDALVIRHLLRDLECLPELDSTAPMSGSSLDVQSVRRRAPAVVVVDTSVAQQLDHRSGPRPLDVYAPWKDIEMIVASGIEVWASLDTSRLSSWVSAVTGKLRSDGEFPQRVKGLDLGR
jgi:two-component system, OmpR family, sensor histidine kinase KdpD